MSGKAATGAKRARANTEAETHEEDPVENELKQEFHELKKVIKVLADTQLQYFSFFERLNGKLNKTHEKNAKFHEKNKEIKALL